MAKKVFAGRKNFRRDFSDCLIRMTADLKGSRHLMPFRKRKADEELYPRIFLVQGSAGTGKSAMVGQFIDSAWGIGSELKKNMKVVTIDCEEVLLKNVMMLRTLIQAVYAAFSDEELGCAGCFSEYAQIERRIAYIHEKVEHLCKRVWVGEGTFDNGPMTSPPIGRQQESEENMKGSIVIDLNHRMDEEMLKGKAFTNWLRDTGKLLDDELDLYENSDYRLSKALVNGIVQLSAQYPVVLAIDGFDRISNHEMEEWMRTVFLGKLFERKNNITVILSGRGNLLHSYRNDFPEELLYSVNFDDYPLTRKDITECSQSYQLQLPEGRIRQIEEATAGVPFIVRHMLALVKDNAPLQELIDESGQATGTTEQKVAAEVKRFFKCCPDADMKKKIVHYACLRRPASTVLAQLWNVPFAEVNSLVVEYASRYPFIVNEPAHEHGHAMLREYLVKEVCTGTDHQDILSIIREFGTVAAPLFLEQMTQLSTAIVSIEKRYDDERFQESVLAYCSTLLWFNNDELFKLLPGILLECLQYNCTFAVRLLQCIDEFRLTLNTKQVRMTDVCISGILSYHPMGMWLGITPSEEEMAMIRIFEEHTIDCNDRQIALLHCRQGELHYRLKDYRKAFEDFRTCLPKVTESEQFKKNVIDDLFALGNKLFTIGDFDAAIQVFGHVVDLRPEDHEAWYAMGRAQTQLGKTADSVLSYIKTVELKPDLQDAWHRLGIAYYDVESYEETVEALGKALAMKPDNAVGWYTLGRAYDKLKRYEEAVNAFARAGQLEPDNKDVWFYSGEANTAIGYYEDAAVSYEKAAQLDSQLHAAWFGMGRACYRLGSFEKAMIAFEKAMQKERGNREYIYNMALSCHSAGAYDRAVRYWSDFLELEPSHAQALYQMALSLHARGQYSDAIQFYMKAAGVMPDNLDVPHNMGRAYQAQGLFNDAVEMYRRALRIDPAKPELWDDLGLVFTAMNLYGDAIQAYKELVRLTPEWKHAWYHLGHTYYVIRHYENALQSYSKAVELDPGYHLAWGSLGLTYYALGNYEKAIEAHSKALSMKPDELWIQGNLALATLLSGNVPQAEVEFDKVIALSKTRDDCMQQIAALEGVMVRESISEQAREILEKLKKALSEK